ncbi:hypothetical protein RFI_08801 [Reticulomyxa filosa]|uniref:Uncharacterized protein n=1 Tax=Reticulomyxa filosa TaxID=46433 RepID=X6NPV7_RETFI|nr:hypothetical protein RFI_08801 [Reticulomyxa filosa]|eukprot:ETO28330.1 hypothetical protein RFI_08801 [Reticulomyxa filosa]
MSYKKFLLVFINLKITVPEVRKKGFFINSKQIIPESFLIYQVQKQTAASLAALKNTRFAVAFSVFLLRLFLVGFGTFVGKILTTGDRNTIFSSLSNRISGVVMENLIIIQLPGTSKDFLFFLMVKMYYNLTQNLKDVLVLTSRALSHQKTVVDTKTRSEEVIKYELSNYFIIRFLWQGLVCFIIKPTKEYLLCQSEQNNFIVNKRRFKKILHKLRKPNSGPKR